MKDLVVIDFETQSAVPIEAGLMNYFTAPFVRPLCLSYKINKEPTKLWKPPQPSPFNPNKSIVYGFNVMFDILAWNMLCPNFTPIKLKNCVDIMAVCGRFTYPQNLDDATHLLNKRTTKSASGKRLIKKICMPPFRYDPAELIELYKYCVQDTESTYELLHKLPALTLSKLEQQVWVLTQEINLRGLPVDPESAELLIQNVNLYLREETGRLQDLTDGAIQTPGQCVAIKKWVNENSDLNLSGVGADVIEQVFLGDTSMVPEEVLEVLKIRKDVGQSSVKKLEHIINASHNSRLYFNLHYYKARTGRYAGKGFQIHNLPRDAVSPEMFSVLFKQFQDRSIFFESEKSPVDYAKMMIRGLVSPTNPLYSLVWFDYANIESRMLFWLARDFVALETYRRGEDHYVNMAAYILFKDPKDITPKERFLGKQAILLCGYGGGAAKLQHTANSYRIMDVSYELAKKAVDGYRKKHKKVKDSWYALADKAMYAVENFNETFETLDIKFKKVRDKTKVPWLRVTIPSGRNLYYNSPSVRRGNYGPEIAFMGMEGKSKTWSKLSLSPQMIIENIIQALARDILIYHKLAINKKYPIIFSVHDEICCEVEDTEAANCFKFMGTQMINPPFWCADLPLDVEGKTAKRWGK